MHLIKIYCFFGQTIRCATPQIIAVFRDPLETEGSRTRVRSAPWPIEDGLDDALPSLVPYGHLFHRQYSFAWNYVTLHGPNRDILIVAYITGAVEMTMIGLTVLLPSLQLPE